MVCCEAWQVPESHLEIKVFQGSLARSSSLLSQLWKPATNSEATGGRKNSELKNVETRKKLNLNVSVGGSSDGGNG